MGISFDAFRARIGIFYGTAIWSNVSLNFRDFFAIKLLNSCGVNISPLIVIIYFCDDLCKLNDTIDSVKPENENCNIDITDRFVDCINRYNVYISCRIRLLFIMKCDLICNIYFIILLCLLLLDGDVKPRSLK